jgi:hypothetical protein
MTRKTTWSFALLASLMWAAVGCGGSSSLESTDPGTGTKTLLVEAKADYESGANFTQLSVRIKKSGADLDGAMVRIASDLGSIDLHGTGGGEYRGTQAGWPGEGYRLEISVRGHDGKETDALQAALLAPIRIEITSPDMSKAIDARNLADQALLISWKGPAADRAEVKSKDFDPAPFAPDPLKIAIPATLLKDEVQDLRITRENSVPLAGGLPGSLFRARYRWDASLIIVNPY